MVANRIHVCIAQFVYEIHRVDIYSKMETIPEMYPPNLLLHAIRKSFLTMRVFCEQVFYCGI